MLVTITPNDTITFGVEYEDEHLAVVSKRAGLVTQPGLGHEDDSLLNGLFARWGKQLGKLGKSRDFGLLHRLDRETSGLLLVALDTVAYDRLRLAFEQREIRKFYWAVTARAPKHLVGLIERPILEATPRTGEKKLAKISPRGKVAATAYRTVQSSELGAILEARPLTGRLHQVRVHLEAIGCPILGDGFYAPAPIADAAPRLALHAHRLAFTHPITGEGVDVRSPWPKDLRATLTRSKLARPDLPADASASPKGD